MLPDDQPAQEYPGDLDLNAWSGWERLSEGTEGRKKPGFVTYLVGFCQTDSDAPAFLVEQFRQIGHW